MAQIYWQIKDYLPIIASLTVLLIIILLRRPLARGLLRIIFSGRKKNNPEHYRLICNTMLKPFSLMLVSGPARLALEYIQPSPKYYLVWANILSSVFLITSFIALYYAAGLAAGLIINNAGKKELKVDPNAANYIAGAIKFTIVVIGIFTILSLWVKDITGLIAGLGIGGLAIALAAQDTAANLFGSIAIMLDKPFEIGDWVETEGIMGTVIRVGLRSSQIRALDQSIISIPNSKLAAGIIANATRRLNRRVAFKIRIIYSTPPEKILAYTERIKQILKSDPDIIEDGAIVRFDNFGDSALEIFICYFTVANYSHMLEVKERINLEILKAARSTGISLALPALSLYNAPEEDPENTPGQKAEGN